MSVVDEVKARLDIVDVIGSYVQLRKAGRLYKANCPFHSEKTPSFTVSPDRQTWHCFGACSTGGDIFTFVQRKENTDFNGALRILASRAGVELQRESPRRDELQPLYDANEAAAIFYHSYLLGGAGGALAYAEARGIDRQAMSDFQIGASPPAWEALRDHLLKKGFTDATLLQAGLLVQNERGSIYDRFRGRLMFPIRDERGRVAGFGGRVLPGASGESAVQGQEGAKYINTPQTPIFDKGGILYGLDRARAAVRTTGTAVIVEGYMDVVAAHQFGHRNVVASMGTALTERQVAAVERLKPQRAVFAMDADAAGNAAALRDVQVAVAVGARRPVPVATPRGIGAAPNLEVEWRVAALPAGVDPDDLIRRDPAQWQALVDGSRPIVDHLIDVVRGALDLTNPRDRATLVAEVLPAVGEVADPVVRASYLQRLAMLAKVPEAVLQSQLRRAPRAPRPRSQQEAGGPQDTPSPSPRVTRAPREEFALALLRRHPHLAEIGREYSDEVFTLAENRELFRRYLRGEEATEEEIWLWEAQKRIDSTLVHVTELEAVKAAFSDCLARLEQARMKAVKEAGALAIAEGEASLSSGPSRRGPGQVAAIAKARWEAGPNSEAPEDGQDEASPEGLASQLLQDMEAGLRFHQRLIDSSRGNQGDRPTG
ncbi:MAG TPA: DNA primase [Dehalococcoidia bacterium]|nr:DNA primase [Dehalococcoidia bacterium]